MVVSCDPVALLAEGVDRNKAAGLDNAATDVALLAEGVDRNVYLERYRFNCAASPSSRRAWIEITTCRRICRALNVALLAEGVDRNL